MALSTTWASELGVEGRQEVIEGACILFLMEGHRAAIGHSHHQGITSTYYDAWHLVDAQGIFVK